MNRIALSIALVITVGCGDEPAPCDGSSLTATPSVVNFGDLRLPLPAMPGTDETVPQDQVIFVRNSCGRPVVVEQVCLYQRGHNGSDSLRAFEFEGPDIMGGSANRLTPGKDAALRVTYDVGTLNSDTDNDGLQDPDYGLLVIDTDSAEIPRYYIPVCGRVVSAPAAAYECEVPEDFSEEDDWIVRCAF